MVFKIPLMTGLHASRNVAQASAQATQSIPLRQMPTRGRQASGGSLAQDGATSQAAPRLKQQAAKARQSLSNGMARLRETFHRGGRQETAGNTAPASGSPPSRLARAESLLTMADSVMQIAHGLQNARPAPAETPEPPMSENARGKQPERPTQTGESSTAPAPEDRKPVSSADIPRPDRRRHLLSSIPEEKYSALKESELNPMQLRAHRAAESDEAERRTRLKPQFAVLALNDKGKLNVADSVSTNLTNILNETLARPQHTWKAHSASADNLQHVLMDPGGKLFSLQGSKTAFIGMTQSQPLAQPGDRIQLDTDGNATLHASGGGEPRNVALPNAATHALLTGIFEHDTAVPGEAGAEESRVQELASEQLREHGGRLYRLNEAAMHWEQVDKDEEKSVGKLTKQADGTLYVVHDKKTLHNVTTGEKSEKFKAKISGYCAGENGSAMVLLSDEKTSKQSVMFLTSLTAKKEAQDSISLKTQDSDGNSQDFHATDITLHNGRLFALDSNGKLFSGTAPVSGDTELQLREEIDRTAQLTAQLGAGTTLSGLVSHGDGPLMAIAKSGGDQKHICAMDDHGRFQAQWNMSESLVLDHHEGLLQPRPLPQDIVDLGRLGQMLIFDDKLYARDKNSGRWEASYEKADSLKRGQDGSGWVLNDGIPARVKVGQKSDKIDGAHHQFALRQMKTSLSLDLPLPGFDANNKARAIAPLDAENCAAISDNNELQYHRTLAGTRQPEKLMKTLTKAGIENWSPNTLPGAPDTSAANGDGNTLTDITTDQKHNLYVLDKQGKLYQMPEADWRAAPGARPDARWQPVALPEELGEIEHLHNVAGGALMVADKAGRSAILQLANTALEAEIAAGSSEDNAGEPTTGNALISRQNAQQIAAADRWLIQPDFDPNKKLEAISHRPEVVKAVERLDEASKSVNIRGMTLKYETSIAGMTGRDGNHVNSRLRDRLGAHLMNTRMSTPRPMKSAYYALQHNWQGREGLRPLYEQQAHLHQAMKNLQLEGRPDQPREALQTRIDGLDTRHFDKTFMAHLKTLGENVADSTRHHASLLGQHAGAVRGDGAEIATFTPSRLTAMTQAMNPWSDDQNLIRELGDLYGRYPLRAGEGNDSRALMSALQEKGVVAHHQKAQPAMGRQRDPHDAMGLVKSRLVLDGLMMAELHDLVDEMKRCSDQPQVSPTEIADIKERFRTLRDEVYGDNLVQKATSQGFINNQQLEACYDAIKSMTNAFSKPHHGLNMTTRTVLKAPDQQEMTAQLLRTLKSLESGESMGFGRSYGGMVTLAVIPGADVVGVPGVRGNLDRAYNASFSRGENGINVTFSRNGGGTGTAFGAVGWNPLSQLSDPSSVKTDLGGNRSIAPSARLGGMVAMSLQRQLQNSVSFTLSEAELTPFIEKLTRGELNPNELLEKGVSHRVKNGTTLTFNVDAAAMAMGGGGLTLPTSLSEPKKNAAVARVSGNLQAGVNLLTAQSEHSVSHSAAGTSLSDSDNRARMLNSANISVGVVGGMGITANAATKLRIPMFGINSTNIQASIDNRTKHSMSLDIAKAEPVHKSQLDKLVEQVGMNFDDPKTNALLQELKDADKTPEKPKNELSAGLKALKEESLRHRGANPAQYRPLSKDEREALEKLRKEDKKPATESTEPTAAKEPEPAKFSTFMKGEQEATAMKLDKLLPHLMALTPANNGQYGVINSARQLNTQRQALSLHCQGLNSAEYQSTYNNLRKVDSNNLMHVVHSLFASELPESGAEAISRFMEEKPMLKEVIRELQNNRNTQAVVTLELKDEVKFELQQMWLNHETQPEEVQAMLKDRSNLRVKSIGFSETDTKQEGINIPLFVTGGSSAANVSISRNLGKINFSYGQNQQTPTAFTLEGETAWAKQSLVDALTNAEIQDKRGRV